MEAVVIDTKPTQKLKREELFSLEQYAQVRDRFRAQVMEHKKRRRLAVGPHAQLHFEDRLTMQYQVQEMLRAERIFEREGIEDELAAFNPLIPDGSNWKATFMLEYPDIEQRERALALLKGIENRIYVRLADSGTVWGIADEDLERADATKTSAVHFLRFELTAPMVAAIKGGATVSVGIDHPQYRHETTLSATVRDTLAADLVV